MHLLTCACGATLPVAASQAGNVITCPRCGAALEVPTLGQLRQLPEAAGADASASAPSLPLWRRLVFAALVAVALASAAWSLFSLLKWQTTDVPTTMAQHIQYDRQQIHAAPPAELARLWAEFEGTGLYEQHPLAYQQAAQTRASWRRTTLGSATLAIVCAAAAALLATAGRRRRPSA